MSDAGKPETGIRKALRKWKDLLKGDTTKKTPPMARGARPPPAPAPAPAATAAAAPPSSAAPSLSSPSPSRDGTTSPLPSHRPVPAPAALFAPTTQTIISSPADPRNRRRRPHASPPSTLKKLPPNPRRNTAPADLFSHPNHSTATPVSIPMNTITTTITATQQPPHKGHARRSSRLRLSLSRRESGSKSPPPPPSSSSMMMTSGSGSGSASGRTSRTSSRATLHSADVAEQGMRWGKDAGTLIKTAEVVRRERRKGWAEDGWREQKREIVGAG